MAPSSGNGSTRMATQAGGRIRRLGNLLARYLDGVTVKGSTSYRVVEGSPRHAEAAGEQHDRRRRATIGRRRVGPSHRRQQRWLPGVWLRGWNLRPGHGTGAVWSARLRSGRGRWTAKDPIRFEGGQSNIYAYAGNSPLNVPLPLWRCQEPGPAGARAVAPPSAGPEHLLTLRPHGRPLHLLGAGLAAPRSVPRSPRPGPCTCARTRIVRDRRSPRARSGRKAQSAPSSRRPARRSSPRHRRARVPPAGRTRARLHPGKRRHTVDAPMPRRLARKCLQ
jgi:hypothetical protein